MKTRVVVFARYPETGKVKTRLGAEIGMEKAARLYEAWLPMVFKTLEELGETISGVIYLAEPCPHQPPLREGWEVCLQEGKNLGERMGQAFENEFEKGWEQVFILGSDMPHLTQEDFQMCLEEGKNAEVVLGPAEDGGYYLIGLKHPPGDLFQGVRWSSPFTLQDTLKNVRRLGWESALGPVGYDLDTLDDLKRLLSRDPHPRWDLLRRILAS